MNQPQPRKQISRLRCLFIVLLTGKLTVLLFIAIYCTGIAENIGIHSVKTIFGFSFQFQLSRTGKPQPGDNYIKKTFVASHSTQKQTTTSATESSISATHRNTLQTTQKSAFMTSRDRNRYSTERRNSSNSAYRETKATAYTRTTNVLTLFTTFKNVPDRYQIHLNVLKNWAQMMPQVVPMLFVSQTDVRLVKQAKDLGWMVQKVPRSNHFDTPTLRDMYFRAMQLSKTAYYGFCNGDILFNEGLLETMNTMLQYKHQLNMTLIVGRRTNFQATGSKAYKFSDVTAIAAEKGTLFQIDAEDYFLIKHGEFPWNKVPALVIGRPAYDNFLVAMAIRNKLDTVDATKTLLALHQTGKDGNYAGHKSKDSKYNKQVNFLIRSFFIVCS